MKYYFILFFLGLTFCTRSQIKISLVEKEADRQFYPTIQEYKYLHQHPELSRMEYNTSAFLKAEMKKLDVEIIDSLGYNSFAAIMRNGKGPVVLYRTDMDGLPIKEETNFPFSSSDFQKREEERLPVMHACGHDIHMATWLAAARIMFALKKQWSGTIVFLAQSAEETGQGAKKITTSPFFSQLPTPEAQIAIHCHAELPAGTMGFCDGFSMAAVDMMTVVIHGRGGHGAAPEKCIDPIVMSAQFINQIQTIVSRNLSSTEPAVITVGAIQGGTVGNIIPSEVTLKLTIRSYSKETRQKILDRIRLIGNNIALSAGMDQDHLPEYDLGDMSIPAVYNQPELGLLLRQLVNEYSGKAAIQEVKPVMIGEDFGVYGNTEFKIPSYLLWVGTSSRANSVVGQQSHSLHTSSFAPDFEATLKSSVRILPLSLLGLLQKK